MLDRFQVLVSRPLLLRLFGRECNIDDTKKLVRNLWTHVVLIGDGLLEVREELIHHLISELDERNWFPGETLA